MASFDIGLVRGNVASPTFWSALCFQAVLDRSSSRHGEYCIRKYHWHLFFKLILIECSVLFVFFQVYWILICCSKCWKNHEMNVPDSCVFSIFNSRWYSPKSFNTFSVFSTPTSMVGKKSCLPSPRLRVLADDMPMSSSRKQILIWPSELVNCLKKR